MDRGFILHSYPYRETSLILQAWTEKHGRLALVAKGARRPKSASRIVLVPFQPLTLDWFGRGELRTLKTAEPTVPATPLAGEALMSAFYMNELLLKLTTRDDPHEKLFEAYDAGITNLRALSRSNPAPRAADIEPVLRAFELKLLQELGYALELAREAGSQVPIAAEREYFYVVERGAVAAAAAAGGETPANAVRLRGLTLIDLERGRFEDPTTVAQSKQLMRLLISHALDGQELATRSLVRDLRQL
ncbi:MAG TPA: DNA repair protein RecO [Usitatibacter sp.]|jgi:DNA repair protein RecO (recombination protein O)|nr:DNA repair protein RecO [Usitatibacter sp.]